MSRTIQTPSAADLTFTKRLSDAFVRMTTTSAVEQWQEFKTLADFSSLLPHEEKKAISWYQKNSVKEKAEEEIRSLAHDSLGKLYEYFSSGRALSFTHLSDVDGLTLLNVYAESIPPCPVIGKVERQGSLLALLVEVRNSDTQETVNTWFAVGSSERTRAGKTTVTTGAVMVQHCLADYLNNRFYADFPSLNPNVADVQLIESMVNDMRQAA